VADWPKHKAECSVIARTKTECKSETRALARFLRKYHFALGAFQRWYGGHAKDFRSRPLTFTVRGENVVGVCPRPSKQTVGGADDKPGDPGDVRGFLIEVSLEEGRPSRLVYLECNDIDKFDLLLKQLGREGDLGGGFLRVFRVLFEELELYETVERVSAALGSSSSSACNLGAV
ncbi:Hypothetical protein UVM_LOCUS484, partial [uncultured virus]